MKPTTTDGRITTGHTTVEDDQLVVTLHGGADRPMLSWSEVGGERSREWLAALQMSRRPPDLRLDELTVTVRCTPEAALAVYEPFVDGEPSLLFLFELKLPLTVTQDAGTLGRADP